MTCFLRYLWNPGIRFWEGLGAPAGIIGPYSLSPRELQGQWNQLAEDRFFVILNLNFLLLGFRAGVCSGSSSPCTSSSMPRSQSRIFECTGRYLASI